MQTYVNRFSCSVSSNKKEVVLNFFQISPKLDSDAKIDGQNIEAVANIVMTSDCAESLIKVLTECLSVPVSETKTEN